MEPGETTKTRTRAPGLDGVRALAVLAVIGFHEGASELSGGFLGVDIFFVLSGFLITDLLVAGSGDAGHLDLKGFWTRRARRLLPALAAMLVVVTAAATFIEPGQEPSLRLALLAAATYTSNWFQILHHVPYFAASGQLGTPPPLDHLWSLAIEEQFYLVWPVIVGLVVARLAARRARVTFALLGAAVSALIMALQYTPGGDPSPVYYGTDTHASALLIGAALALACPLRTLAAMPADRARRLDMAGVGGLVVLAWAAGHFSGSDPAVYPAGLILAALGAAALVAAAAGRGVIAAITSWPPLRWVGARSYGIYLWHWPVIALGTALAGRDAGSPGLWLVETGVTIALAAASWRFIETPVMRDGLRATVRRWARLVAAGLPPGTRRARARHSRRGGRGRGDHPRGGLLRHRPAARAGRPRRAAAAGGQRRAGKQRLPGQPAIRHVPFREAAGLRSPARLRRPGDGGRRLRHACLSGGARIGPARRLHRRQDRPADADRADGDPEPGRRGTAPADRRFRPRHERRRHGQPAPPAATGRRAEPRARPGQHVRPADLGALSQRGARRRRAARPAHRASRLAPGHRGPSRAALAGRRPPAPGRCPSLRPRGPRGDQSRATRQPAIVLPVGKTRLT